VRRGAWAGGIAGINEVYGSATLAEALAFGEAVGLDRQTVLERARTSNFENARRKASAGVHFSFGIGLPFFGAVVAPGPQPAEFAPRGSFRAHVGLTVLAACTATSLQETARLSGAGGVVFAEADRHAGHLPHRSLTLATTPPSASRRRRSR